MYDDFFKYKTDSWVRPTVWHELGPNDCILTKHFATRWLMIPFTRAIDTLLLNVRDGLSLIARTLSVVAGQCGDFLQWIKL